MQTQAVIDRSREVLIQTYEELDPDSRALLLARSVLSGIDLDSPTMQALAHMVFDDNYPEAK